MEENWERNDANLTASTKGLNNIANLPTHIVDNATEFGKSVVAGWLKIFKKPKKKQRILRRARTQSVDRIDRTCTRKTQTSIKNNSTAECSGWSRCIQIILKEK